MPWANRPKGSTTARGYGAKHAKARREAAKVHQPSDPCTRCRRPLGPMGSWLNYDHTDDGTAYLGFAHGDCNRNAGARLGAARSHQRLPRRTRAAAVVRSRDW